MGEYGEAVELLDEAIDLLYEAPGVHPSYLTAALDDRALLDTQLGRFGEAGDRYTRAMEYDEAHSGSIPGSEFYSMHNLAGIRAMNGDYAGALELYQEVLAGREELFGERDESVAATLAGLGEVYLALGRLEEAEAALRRGLDIDREHFGPEHPLSLIHI